MYIDPDLEKESQHDPKKVVDVIIVCDEVSNVLHAGLEQSGFRATDREHAEQGVIYGRIRLGDLAALRHVQGIKSVSLDSPQYAL